MKNKCLFLLIFINCFTASVTFSQTYCLKLTTLRTGNNVDVTMLLLADSLPFRLGSSNVQFKFKYTSLSSPMLFQNLLPTDKYEIVSVTNPTPPIVAMAGDSVASLNFEFIGLEGQGITVPTVGGIRIGVMRFRNVDLNILPNFRIFDNGTAGSIVYEDSDTKLIPITRNCSTVLSGLFDVVDAEKRLKIYPNPVKDAFLSVDTEGVEWKEFTIYNLLGQPVIRGKGRENIDVSLLETGVYVLKIGVQKAIFTKL